MIAIMPSGRSCQTCPLRKRCPHQNYHNTWYVLTRAHFHLVGPGFDCYQRKKIRVGLQSYGTAKQPNLSKKDWNGLRLGYGK